MIDVCMRQLANRFVEFHLPQHSLFEWRRQNCIMNHTFQSFCRPIDHNSKMLFTHHMPFSLRHHNPSKAESCCFPHSVKNSNKNSAIRLKWLNYSLIPTFGITCFINIQFMVSLSVRRNALRIPTTTGTVPNQRADFNTETPGKQI